MHAIDATAMNGELPWHDPPVRCREVEVERDVAARMRDGTVLLADVYRPIGLGACPVLLMRLPYNKTHAETFTYAHPSWYARYGYQVVVQDCRGRWASEGEWCPYRHEATDGADTIAWAAALPGSTGQVGTYGFSYAGAAQLLAALESPPALAALMPAMASSGFYDHWTYRGGALQYAFVHSWALLLAHDTARRRRDQALCAQLAAALRNMREHAWARPYDPPLLGHRGIAAYYFDWLGHDCDDAYWQQWAIRGRYDQIRTPALHIAGWYDVFLEGALENFAGLREHAATADARQHQKLVVGPWYHNPWHQRPGALDFGSAARSGIDALQVLWLDRHLRGERNQLADESPVALFVMGENRWRFAAAWPPSEARPETLFLRSNGRANSLNGTGRLTVAGPADDELPDVYVYDPADPVPSLGGHSCCADELSPMGAADQRAAEVRMDVLVYTSEILTDDLLVIGTVDAVLYAASTAVDTDFTAKLVDVHPDGRAINVADGVVRARFRESLAAPRPIEPNRIYEYRIRIGSTAMRFAAGHRVRLEISSSNFPALDRNSNTGKRLCEVGPTDGVLATQTVFHDARYPSRMILPVIR
jgi:putative CocE/NonD family hydrolase